MGSAVLYMSMSVDGFVTGPDDGPGNGLGEGGERLHAWLAGGSGDRRDTGHLSGADRAVMDEVLATGAVVVGRRTFEHAQGWGGDHHDGVPIVVLSRGALDPALRGPAVTVTDDVADAVRTAREAAGGRDVLVHGAVTAQSALAAGALDELQITLVPVLLGRGRRLFGDVPPDRVELELVRAADGRDVQHLRYRVRKEG